MFLFDLYKLQSQEPNIYSHLTISNERPDIAQFVYASYPIRARLFMQYTLWRVYRGVYSPTQLGKDINAFQ